MHPRSQVPACAHQVMCIEKERACFKMQFSVLNIGLAMAGPGGAVPPALSIDARQVLHSSAEAPCGVFLVVQLQRLKTHFDLLNNFASCVHCHL